jgi:hypothetical protein
MISVESNVGAVVELRFIGVPGSDEVADLERKTGALVKSIVQDQGRRAILCTDLRACAALPRAVSDRVLASMRHDDPDVERSGFFASESATINLQVHRVILEAGDRERRRIFKDGEQLLRWLSEVARTSEQVRLRDFLAESSPASFRERLCHAESPEADTSAPWVKRASSSATRPRGLLRVKARD